MRKWMQIKGYQMYRISNSGKIISGYGGGKVLKTSLNNQGYQVAHLTRYGKSKNIKVHRILAELFIPNPRCLPEVNHKDGNKSNNDLSNLEWVTKSENLKHAASTKLQGFFYGHNHPNSIFSKEDISKIKELRIKKHSYREIAIEIGCSASAVCSMINGRTSYINGKKMFKEITKLND